MDNVKYVAYCDVICKEYPLNPWVRAANNHYIGITTYV